MTVEEAPDILVVGGDGTIGSALVRRLTGRGARVLATGRRPGAALSLDLGAPEETWPALPPGLRTAFVCAAVARQDQCRRDPEGSRRVNVTGTLALVRRLRAMGTAVVWLSTNQVFEGFAPHIPADAPRSPRQTYGRQKAEAEEALLGLGDGVCVVRLSKVVTSDMPLVRGWLERIRAGRTIRPFHDMTIAPVAIDRLVDALDRIGARAPSGVVQYTGPQDLSYAEAARLVADAIGVPDAPMEPMSWRDAGLDLEWVPPYTSLDVARLVEEFGIRPEDSRDALLRVCVGGKG